jgi:hypothetical protein
MAISGVGFGLQGPWNAYCATFLIGQVSKDYETIQNGEVNQSVKITVKTM